MVLGWAACMAALALPSMRHLSERIGLATHAREWLTSATFARQTALQQGVRVVMCRSDDGRRCGGSAGWEGGWIVYADRNASGQREADEPLWWTQAAWGGRWRVQANAPLNNELAYTPQGRSETLSGAFQAGSMTLCPAHNGPVSGIRLIVNSMGRARTERVELSSCP